MKLVPTRRTDYGMQAMIFLAAEERAGATGRDRYVHASKVAEAMGLPVNFLRQVLGELARAHLVVSAPSSTGGYALARPAVDISMLEIVEALEGPLRDGECAVRGGPCHWEDVCPLHVVWTGAREALATSLSYGSLAEVAERELLLRQGKLPAPTDSHRHSRQAAGDGASTAHA